MDEQIYSSYGITEKIRCNALRISVGTNCPQGGDAGHGGRTFLELKDLCNTDWYLTIDDKQELCLTGKKVTLTFLGDSEFETLLGALKFAVKILERSKNDRK